MGSSQNKMIQYFFLRLDQKNMTVVTRCTYKRDGSKYIHCIVSKQAWSITNAYSVFMVDTNFKFILETKNSFS